MGALTDLLKSERGLVALALIVAATVLVVTGHMLVDQWLTYTQVVAIAYIAGKSVTSAVETIKGVNGVPSAEPAATDVADSK